MRRDAAGRKNLRIGRGSMGPFFRKLFWMTGRRRREAELRQELEFHLQEEAELRASGGLPRADAPWAARRELGNLTLIGENTRASWGWTFLDQFLQDCRYGVRTMRANPMFSALAVLSLALGIGANT